MRDIIFVKSDKVYHRMSIKGSIFTRGEATSKNNNFGVHEYDFVVNTRGMILVCN